MKKKNYLSFWVFFMSILGTGLVSPSACLSQSVQEWELKSSQSLPNFQTVAHTESNTIAFSSIDVEKSGNRVFSVSFYKDKNLINKVTIDSPFKFNVYCCDYVAPLLVGGKNTFAYFYSTILPDGKSSRIFLSLFSDQGVLIKTSNIDELLPVGYFDYMSQSNLGVDGNGYYLLMDMLTTTKTHYAHLMRFDNMLNLKSTKSLPAYSDAGMLYGNWVGATKSPDGGFLIASVRAYGAPGGSPNYSLVKIDSLNNQVFQKDISFSFPSPLFYTASTKNYGVTVFDNGKTCGVFQTFQEGEKNFSGFTLDSKTGNLIKKNDMQFPLIQVYAIKSITDTLFSAVGEKLDSTTMQNVPTLTIFSFNSILYTEQLGYGGTWVSGIDTSNFLLLLSGSFTPDSTAGNQQTGFLRAYSKTPYMPSGPTGISDVYLSSNLNVYPNPVNHGSVVNIENSFSKSGTTIILSDMSGKELSSTSASFILAPDLPGMYILRIEDGQKQAFKKLIVQ